MLERLRDPVAWTSALQLAKMALAAADAERLAAVRAGLDELVAGLDPEGHRWPIYGALIVNLRNIVESLDVVATVQPVEVAA